MQLDVEAALVQVHLLVDAASLRVTGFGSTSRAWRGWRHAGHAKPLYTKDVRRSRSTTAFPDFGELVERLNLRRVYYWLGLAGAVGLIGGLGALAFKAILDLVIGFAWPTIISFVPG